MDKRICAFGLYAPLNAEWLRGLGADEIFGGEFEEELAAIARSLSNDAERGAGLQACDLPGSQP